MVKTRHLPIYRRAHNKTYKKKNIIKKNHTIIGVVHAKWCGHCQVLMPKWRTFKNQMKNNKQISVIDIEDGDHNKESRLAQLNLKINDKSVKIEANGFPTIFKIVNGNLEYYSGNREPDALKNWALSKHNAVIKHEPIVKPSSGFFNIF